MNTKLALTLLLASNIPFACGGRSFNDEITNAGGSQSSVERGRGSTSAPNSGGTPAAAGANSSPATAGADGVGGALPTGGFQTTGGGETGGTTVIAGSPDAFISLGFKHSCVLMSGGGVRCWGNNEVGQLGDGTSIDRSTPPTTDVLTGVQAIAAGDDHTCGVCALANPEGVAATFMSPRIAPSCKLVLEPKR